MTTENDKWVWKGIYTAHGIFGPYPGSASLRGEIIGLARIDDARSGFGSFLELDNNEHR
jgi:hypothetical protein